MAFLLLVLGVATATAQTPGAIFKRAGTGRLVLDPNADNYTSATPTGFTTSDVTQSELLYTSLPQLVIEPTSDLGPGPNCKFTDFVDLPTGEKAVGFRTDAASNLMWRFRLGGSAPNTKGYSVAIDTDGKFGFTGTDRDPNAVVGNPGFEIEISLITGQNNGVRLYNIDGRSTANGNPPNGPGPDGSLVQLAFDDYAQKSVALSTNCGDLDVFYDFYMPASVVNANVPASLLAAGGILATPIRMVGNTMIAPHTMTKTQNISDLGGVDDAAYGYNYDAAFVDLITIQTPVTPTGVGTTGGVVPKRSVPPVVNGPIQTGQAFVTGTSVEPVGSTITVYQNGVSIGTTTVQAGGIWTLSGLASNVLITGRIITATVQDIAGGESVSALSNEVPVRGPQAPAPCATAAPTVACATERGIQGTVLPNAILRFYNMSGQQVDLATGLPAATTYTATATGQYPGLCSGSNANPCATAQPCLAIGSYTVTQQAPGAGQCESAGTDFCLGSRNGSTIITATPIVTQNPVLNSMTSITGTAVANSTVYLYSGGLRIQTVTATAGGAFTFSGLTLTPGENLTVRALSAAACLSAPVLRTVQQRAAVAPVVNSPIYTGATSVSGTSVEAPGSTITVFVGGVSVGTTTVQANGTWTLSGLTPLTAGQQVSATVTPSGAATSPLSNVVTVQTRTTNIPVITGTYVEGNTSVTGTSASPVGTVINVYEDDFLIGTTTVQAGGTWTLSGLTNSSGIPALYAGGVLNATATQTGQAESVYSNSVIVGCPTLTANNAVTATPNPICSGDVTNVTIGTSEELLYTLQNAANGTNLSYSQLGGTNPFTITSFALTATTTIRVQSIKIGAVTCTQNLTTQPVITVNPLPNTTLTLGTTQNPVCPGETTNVTVASSEIGVQYQLKNGAANVGTPVTGTGGTINLPTGALAATTTFTVQATDVTRPTNCSRSVSGSVTVTVRTNCSADVATIITGPTTANSGATVTYTAVTTNNGADVATNVVPTITLVPNLAAGSVILPVGATYNAATGVVTFATIASLAANATVNNAVQVVMPISGTVQATAASTSLIPDATPANNNGSQPAATVTTVINQFPVANNDTRNTPQATAITFSVTANDTDPNGNGTINPATVDLDPATAGIQTTFTVAGQGTYSVNNLGNLTFTPVAGFTGISSITYTVQDTQGATSNAATVSINVGPLATNDAVSTVYNVPTSVNVTTNDVDANGLNVATVDLDPATAGIQTTFTVAGQGTFTVDNTGVVTFTPSGTFAGTTSVSYTVQDNVAGNAATSNVATLTVTTTNAAPVAVADQTNTRNNTPVTFAVTANDTDANGNGTINTASIDLDPATAGIQTSFTVAGQGTFTTVGAPAGSVTFTPLNSSFTGIASTPYTVNDAAGATSNAATIAVNVGPLAANDASSIAFNAASTSVNVTTNDVDANGLNVATVDLDPATAGIQTTFTVAGQGTFTVNAAGVVTFTPSGTFAGTTSVSYTVQDNVAGNAATSNTATYTVTTTNAAPVAVADAVNTPSNTPVSFNVVSNDTDANGNGTINAASVDLDPATAGIQTTLTVAGQGTYAVNAAGVVTFTPAANYTGTSSISYTVNDNLGATSNAATFTVNVGPLAANDVASGAYNVPTSVNVTTNDVDANGVNVATVDLDPATAGIQTTFTVAGQGTFTVDNAGLVTFTPSGTFVGNSSVSYTVQDNTGATSNVATLTVTTTNVAPVTVADVAFTTPNTPVTFPVTGNDSDADGSINAATVDLDPATAGTQTSFTVAGQGTFTVDNLGSVTFTPVTNFTGSSSIPYTVNDNTGSPSASALITVHVGPLATNDVATSTLGQSVRLAGGTNDTDSEGVVLTTVDLDPATPGIQTSMTVVGQGTFAVDGATGEVIFAPAPTFAGGVVTIPYVVSDVNGAVSNVATLSATVAPYADVVTTLTGTTSASVGQTVTYTVTTINNGPSAAQDVVVRVLLPLFLLNPDGTPFSVAGATYSPTTGELVYNTINTLANGQSVINSFAFRMPATGTASGRSSSTSSNTGDPVLANNDGSQSPAQVNTSGAPLPVELISFTATARRQDAVLTWATASEKNSAYFSVERSFTGRTFTEINQQKGAGTSVELHKYSVVDANVGRAYAGLVYYRLRQVDLDGKVAYSSIQTVDFAGQEADATLVVYPNPATASTSIDLQAVPAGTYETLVYDALGRVVLRRPATVSGVEALDLRALPTGSYHVQVRGVTAAGAPLRLTAKLVKE